MLERLLIAAILIALGLVAYRLFVHWHRTRASHAAMSPGSTTAMTPAILYFRSDHCTPCTTQARFLEQLAAQYGPRVTIQKIDADREPEAAGRYGIFTIPTTLVLDQAGQVRHANYGLADMTKLRAQVQPLVGG
jgi:thioredoxin-like negative regulator of GroEL